MSVLKRLFLKRQKAKMNYHYCLVGKKELKKKESMPSKIYFPILSFKESLIQVFAKVIMQKKKRRAKKINHL